MDKGSPVGTQGIIVEGLVFSQTMELLQNDFIDKNIVPGSQMPGNLGDSWLTLATVIAMSLVMRIYSLQAAQEKTDLETSRI